VTASSAQTDSKGAEPAPAASEIGDPRRWAAAQELFERALEKPAAKRAAYVEGAVVEDPWLHEVVLDLLAFDEVSSPLDQPWLSTGGEVLDVSAREGDRVGKYRLLERIGAGGMGRVYRAERIQGVVRHEVAIKVLHTGVSPEKRDRFLQEQRILAGLDHPNITRLLDFGTTDCGVTYLVMNLVKGTSICDFADRLEMSVEARIELFLQVCDAVDHAHRRLVVHRDLKPANVLVDDHGQVQLVDFGIAKLLNPQEHLGGEATHTGLRPMTPSYASPEQLFGRPITTATDVWALGVLLFELLAGQRPFDWSGMPWIEIERRLELEPAPKPSALFASANAKTSRLAGRRGLDPRRLRRRLRGDLDIVIGRALARDPDDRYNSAKALARDLERYLAGRPILARRPSPVYEAGKFLRRHFVAVSVLAAMVVCLFGFSVLQTLQSRRLTTERDIARQQRDKAELMSDLLASVLHLANPVNRELNQEARALLAQSTRRILTDFEGQPEAQATLLTRVGNLYHRLGDYDEAEELLTRALEIWERQGASDRLEAARALDALGFVYHEKRDPRALATLTRGLKTFWRAHKGDHPDIARALENIAKALRYEGELEKAETLLRRAIAMDRRLGNEETAEAGNRLSDLGVVVGLQGERREALALFDQALEIQSASWGPRSVPVGLTLNRKARLFLDRQRAEEGARLLRAALEIFRDLLPDDHPLVATGYHNLAHMHVLLGELEEAESLERRAWERDLRRLGEEHPSTLNDRQALAMILREQGRLAEAEEHLRHSVAVMAKRSAAEHPALLSMRNDLARVLLERGRLDLAEKELHLALEAAIAGWGPDHWRVGVVQIGLAEGALSRGDFETAHARGREAVRIFAAEGVGDGKWRLGEAKSALGAALAGLGRHGEAESNLSSAVETLRRKLGPSVTTRRAEERLSELESLR